MSFLAPKVNTPEFLDPTQADRQSNWSEAKPAPFVAGNGRQAARWLCQPTEPKLVEVGDNHDYYFVDIAGHFGLGLWSYIYQIYINGKPIQAPAYVRQAGENFKDFTLDLDGGRTNVQTTMRLYWGTETQTADATLNGFHSGQTHPGYRGQVYAVFQNLPAGEFTPQVPNVELTFRRDAPWTHNLTTYDSPGQGQGVNPVSALIDIVTHTRGGLGLDQDAVLNMDDMVTEYNDLVTDAAAKLPAAGYAYISPQLTRKRRASEWLELLSTYFDGFYRLKDGLIEVGRFPQEAPTELSPSQYTELSQHDLTEPPTLDYPNAENWLTGVAVTHYDVGREYKRTTLPVNSPHMRKVLDGTRVEELDRTWLFYPQQAQIFGDRYLAERNAEVMTGVIKVRKAKAVHPDNANVPAALRGTPLEEGDIFKFDYGPRTLDLWARITRRRETASVVELSWTQEHGTHPLAYEPPEDPVPDLTLPTPAAIPDWRLVEAPYALFPRDKTALIPLVERPSRAVIQYDLAVDEVNPHAGNEDTLEEQFGFATAGDVDTAIPNQTTDTTITCTFAGADADILQDQVDLAAVDGRVLIFVEDEIMSVKTVTPTATADQYDIVVQRAMFGTDAAGHADTTTAWAIPRARLLFWDHERFQDIFDGNGDYSVSLATLYFTIRSRNYFGVSDWSAEVQLILSDRAPPPPADLTLTPQNYALEVTWTPITAIDSSRTWVQFDTSAAFDDNPTIHSVIPDGHYVIPHLSGGVAYHVRLASVDRNGNVGDWSAAVSATTLLEPGNVPDFSAYGIQAGEANFSYKLNFNRLNAAEDGAIKISGSVFRHPGTGQWYALPQPYAVKIYDFGGGSPLQFYLVHLGSDRATDIWPAGNFPNPVTENIVVPCLYAFDSVSGTNKFYLVDEGGVLEELPTGNDYVLFAWGRIHHATGKIIECVTVGTGLEKPVERELEFNDKAAMEAYDFTAIPDKAAVTTKGRANNLDGVPIQGVWDASSTANADDLTVFKPTAMSTGRVLAKYDRPINVLQSGVVGDGATDDTAAFSTFLTNVDAAGYNSVFIPKDKTLLIDGSVTVPAGVTIYGPGKIKLSTGTANSLVLNTGCGVDGVEFEIADAYGGRAIYAIAKEKLRVVNNRFNGATSANGYSVYLDARCGYALVAGNEQDGCGNFLVAIQIYGSRMVSNSVLDCGVSGIRFFGAQNNTVANNYVENPVKVGITFFSARQAANGNGVTIFNTVDGNTVKDAGEEAIGYDCLADSANDRPENGQTPLATVSSATSASGSDVITLTQTGQSSPSSWALNYWAVVANGNAAGHIAKITACADGEITLANGGGLVSSLLANGDRILISRGCFWNTFSNNTVENSDKFGIYLWGSSWHNQIVGNTIGTERFGVAVTSVTGAAGGTGQCYSGYNVIANNAITFTGSPTTTTTPDIYAPILLRRWDYSLSVGTVTEKNAYNTVAYNTISSEVDVLIEESHFTKFIGNNISGGCEVDVDDSPSLFIKGNLTGKGAATFNLTGASTYASHAVSTERLQVYNGGTLVAEIDAAGDLYLYDGSGNEIVELSSHAGLEIKDTSGTVLARLGVGGDLSLFDSGGAEKARLGDSELVTVAKALSVRDAIGGNILGQIDGTGGFKSNDASGNTRAWVRTSSNRGIVQLYNSGGTEVVRIGAIEGLSTDNQPIQVRNAIGGTVVGEIKGNGDGVLQGLNLENIPTSDPAVANEVWKDASGFLRISSG